MTKPRGAVVVTALMALGLAPASAGAQGHGPLYGLSTPTLGKGAWSLDVGSMVRILEGRRTVMVRPMLSYGVTEDVQAFVSLPVALDRDAGVPAARALTRMPANRDVELGVGWRVHRRGTGVGSRRETTVWAALDRPVDEQRGGVPTSTGAVGALVTGYASRSLYFWAGGAHRRYAGSGGSRPGDTTMASLVLGYRPGFLRDDYPSPDWRAFVEVVGEWTGDDVLDGRPVEATGGREVFVALTALGLYGWWGVAGGPAFPVVQEFDGDRARDRVRLALNLTFWW